MRVGTHALTSTSRTTLWRRLSQHRGQEKSGSGNHRGSIFRLLIGSTLTRADGVSCPAWGSKKSPPPDTRTAETPAEREVSRIIRAMPFLWLAIYDPPGRDSMRGYVERNSIALLSNFIQEKPLDPASSGWRGRTCIHGEARVRDSGLWNQKHVDEGYNTAFLDALERLVDRTAASR